jgi:hypothetical protein
VGDYRRRPGAVGKGPQGTSLAAYPTARPVLNGGDKETGLSRPRLVATQLECGRYCTLMDSPKVP